MSVFAGSEQMWSGMRGNEGLREEGSVQPLRLNSAVLDSMSGYGVSKRMSELLVVQVGAK